MKASTSNAARRALFFALCLGTLQVCGAASPSKKLDKALERGDRSAVVKVLLDEDGKAAGEQKVLERSLTGEANAVQMLLEAGADGVNLKERALLNAARVGKVDIARLLLERGAKVDWQERAYSVRPSGPGWMPPPGPTDDYANLGPFQVPEGQMANFKLTITENAGNSALSAAVLAKKADVVKLLLERGANKDLVVIHQEPEFEVLNTLGNTGRQMLLDGSTEAITLRGKTKSGRALEFVSEKGVIRTNSPFAFEKRATVRELAKKSGDAAISGQF